MNKADQVKNSYAVVNNQQHDIEEDMALPNDEDEKSFYKGFKERLQNMPKKESASRSSEIRTSD